MCDGKPQNQTIHDPSLLQPFVLLAENYTVHTINESNSNNQFRELGHRVQAITSWFLKVQDSLQDVLQATPDANYDLLLLAESSTLTHFPFLRNESRPNDPTPVTSLRRTYVASSRGLVIPVGARTLRFAIHLILNLRTVLGTRLPIQIVYAGNDDLSALSRAHLQKIEPDVEFIDILTIFDNKIMDLMGWAVKPVTALARTFETVLVLDADTVFFQKPEILLDDSQYKSAVAFFFHDRLIWKDALKDRYIWWKEQMEGRLPSKSLKKSLVWKENYAEEADSGVVVLDKRRFPLLMGLLHVC